MSHPYMPLFTGDYRRDTMHLSALQHGIYLQLIIAYWDRAEPLPQDERRLGALCNARSHEEVGAMREVLGEFFVLLDGLWHHERIENELARADAIVAKKRKAGLSSANARRANAKKLRDNKRLERATGVQHTFNTCSTDAEQVLERPDQTRPDQTRADQSRSEEKNYSPDGESSKSGDLDHQPRRSKPVPIKAIVDAYAEALPDLPQWNSLTDTRTTAIRARWHEVRKAFELTDDADTLAWFVGFFGRVAQSDFLTGQVEPAPGRRPFMATLDWLMRPSNFHKVAEGNYDAGRGRVAPSRTEQLAEQRRRNMIEARNLLGLGGEVIDADQFGYAGGEA